MRLAISLINLDDFEIHNVKFHFSLTSTKEGFFVEIEGLNLCEEITQLIQSSRLL